jgi:RNA polymerase sigma-70 factor (ECF subfamily)
MGWRARTAVGHDASVAESAKERCVHEQRQFGNFEQVVLPHLDAAYNLARWLTRREHDAEDIVQDAYLRAFNAFPRFHGGDARCWLLTIVRNTCYSWLTRNRGREPSAGLDEVTHEVASCASDPQVLYERHADREAVRAAIAALPVESREVLILREFEGLSYQQVADVVEVPVGTVMSRLARARSRLARALGAGTTSAPTGGATPAATTKGGPA